MKSEEVISLVQSIVTIAKEAAPLWSIAGVIIFYLYARSRAGSSGFIRERIWRILGGSKEYQDPEMKEQWKKVRDYERFRFNSGLPLPSNAKIAKTLFWLKNNNVGLEELIPIAKYFDCELIAIKDPHLGRQRAATGILSLIFLAWILFFSAFLAPYALLTVKTSGTTFWMDADSAHAWNLTTWSVTSDACNGQNQYLSPKDNEVVCDLLHDEKREKYVSDAIFEQRGLAGSFVAVGFYCLFIVLRGLGFARKADKLFHRVNERDIAPDTSS